MVLVLFLALFAYFVVFLTVELSPTEPNQCHAADEDVTRASFAIIRPISPTRYSPSTPVRHHYHYPTPEIGPLEYVRAHTRSRVIFFTLAHTHVFPRLLPPKPINFRGILAASVARSLLRSSMPARMESRTNAQRIKDCRSNMTEAALKLGAQKEKLRQRMNRSRLRHYDRYATAELRDAAFEFSFVSAETWLANNDLEDMIQELIGKARSKRATKGKKKDRSHIVSPSSSSSSTSSSSSHSSSSSAAAPAASVLSAPSAPAASAHSVPAPMQPPAATPSGGTSASFFSTLSSFFRRTSRV